MTELDHSSVSSLLADLDRHRGGLFRFKYQDDGTTSLPWRLKMATTVESGVVRIRVEYIALRRGSVCAVVGQIFSLRLSDGWLTSGIVPRTVVLDGPLRGSSVVDDSQRRRLDKNLRGVFS